jgi:hypothetical protein
MLTNSPRKLPDIRCSGEVSVAQLQNAKIYEAIGRRDGDALYPANTSVGQWAAEAVAEQVAACGCGTIIVQHPGEADTEWVVSGDVRKAFVDKTGVLDYETTLALQVNLLRDKEKVFGKEVKFSSQKTASFPSSDLPSQYLDEAISDAVAEVVPDLVRRMAEEE